MPSMTNIRKYLAVGVAAAFLSVVVTLAVVSFGEDQAVTTKPSEVAPVAVTVAPQTPMLSRYETAFLTLVKQRMPSVATDASWLSLGHWTCTSFRGGLNIFQIAAQMEASWGLSEGNAGYAIGASVAAFCPEYQASISAPGRGI